MKEPQWILEKTVTAIHSEQIAEHGGASGIRDHSLLLSALDSPKNIWHYNHKVSLFSLAAAYAYKICNNHPFTDGNKRTAYVVCRLFLILNGFDIAATEEERVILFQELADGKISEQELTGWFETHSRKI